MIRSNFSFVQGPISPQKVTDEILRYGSEEQIGAYSLFLGQVRNDLINGKEVRAIEYSSYKEMVIKKFDTLSIRLFKAYEINELRVLHSLDLVPCGGISLLVLTTAGHRYAAIDACREAVDLIKSELPIWGKELFKDGEHVWKSNT